MKFYQILKQNEEKENKNRKDTPRQKDKLATEKKWHCSEKRPQI